LGKQKYRNVICNPENQQFIIKTRDVYFVDAKGYHKIMGIPITKTELVMKLEEMLGGKNWFYPFEIIKGLPEPLYY